VQLLSETLVAAIEWMVEENKASFCKDELPLEGTGHNNGFHFAKIRFTSL